jgi:hypothetical protein
MLAGMNGCSISASKDEKTGKDKNVDIRTPFGSLSVHKGASDIKDTGLAAYPGARLRQDTDDNESANVNISSSVFGLKVVAMKYQSSDAPDKILAFYRKDMAKYGKVLDCTGGFNMSFRRHDRDSEVTCDNDGSDHSYHEELKVGTEHNQRIVAVKPSGAGSEFAVVYVRAWDDKTAI